MLKAWDVLGNSQRLDGGAMFGNAPRPMWSRWCKPDDLGRIDLACRALLIRTDEHTILLETGIGSFFPPDLRERYGVVEQEHVLLDSLARRGVTPSDVDFVVLSHLHFDHAGGLLAPYQEGVPARLIFDKAQFLVGRRAWDRARAPHPRDRASFIVELNELLETSGRLTVLEDASHGRELLGPAFSFHESHGHTPGMLLTQVSGAQRSLFFAADLIPGRPWVHLPITMGYDRYPEALIDEKAQLMPRFERDGTWLFFTHDPGAATARVGRDARGRFSAKEAHPNLGEGWDLDS